MVGAHSPKGEMAPACSTCAHLLLRRFNTGNGSAWRTTGLLGAQANQHIYIVNMLAKNRVYSCLPLSLQWLGHNPWVQNRHDAQLREALFLCGQTTLELGNAEALTGSRSTEERSLKS